MFEKTVIALLRWKFGKYGDFDAKDVTVQPLKGLIELKNVKLNRSAMKFGNMQIEFVSIGSIQVQAVMTRRIPFTISIKHVSIVARMGTKTEKAHEDTHSVNLIRNLLQYYFRAKISVYGVGLRLKEFESVSPVELRTGGKRGEGIGFKILIQEYKEKINYISRENIEKHGKIGPISMWLGSNGRSVSDIGFFAKYQCT